MERLKEGLPWGLVVLLGLTLLIAALVSNLMLAGVFIALAALLELLVELGKRKGLLPANEWVVRVLFVGLLLLFVGAAQRGYIPLVAVTGIELIDVAVTAAVSTTIAVLVTYALNYLLQGKLGPAPRRAAALEASEWVE